MSKPVEALPAHPLGEQSSVEFLPEAIGLCADTFGGRVHVEWDPTAAATPFGQLPFFVEFLKLGGLFDPWVVDCPLTLMSPNAPAKRDILAPCCWRFWPGISATRTSPHCAARV